MSEQVPDDERLREGDVFQKDGREWLVTKTTFDGGGAQLEMSGHYSSYPSGHHVWCIRLAEDGTYDPKGKREDFWQTGFFDRMRGVVPVVRQMRLMWVAK